MSLRENITSSVTKRPISILRFIGVRKNIWIKNKSSKRARILLTPTQIGHISKIGVNGPGSIGANAEIQWEGTAHETDEIIGKGKTREFWLKTSDVYLTIFIEFDTGWKQFRKNRLVNGWRTNYNIIEANFDECVEIQEVSPN